MVILYHFYLDVANDDMRIGLKCYLLFNGGDDRVSVLTVDKHIEENKFENDSPRCFLTWKR